MAWSKKQRILERLAGEVRRIDAPTFAALRTEYAVSESYLRQVLRESGRELAPAVEGVRQDNFLDLERTLLQLRPQDRALVLTAKQHARLAMRSPRVDRRIKGEMIRWMDVWLSGPELFGPWVDLRKRTEEFAALIRKP